MPRIPGGAEVHCVPGSRPDGDEYGPAAPPGDTPALPMRAGRQPSRPSTGLCRVVSSGWFLRVLGAGGLVVAGAVVGWVVRWVGVRLLRVWSDRLSGGAVSFVGGEFQSQFERAHLDETSLLLFGRSLFVLVFLVFVAAATETLELPVVSTWVLGLAGYLPQVFAAALVMVLGLLAGSVFGIAVAQGASTAGLEYAAPFGRMVQLGVIGVSAVVAVDQLGIEVSFLVIAVSIALAASLGGAALAFGLGARTAVSNIIATHYLARTYEVGQRVGVGDHEGRIAEIGPTAVTLETAGGRAHIPAKEFSEQISTLIEG